MPFDVTLRRIAEVIPHPNADRLDIVHLENYDYDSIVQKGKFSADEVVIYFPVDSQLPMAFVQALGLEGKLSHGSHDADGVRLQNRVKTAKLRGIVSQGIVASLSDLPLSAEARALIESAAVGSSLMETLGVTKYEPPTIAGKDGTLVSLPDRVSKYDLESAQSYTPVVAQMIAAQIRVMVTEKLEGSHWFVTRTREGDYGVGQRNYLIEPVPEKEHVWHRVAREGGYEAHTQALLDLYPDAKRATIRGELVGPGVTGNYYNLSTYGIYVFEIELDGEPVNPATFKQITERLNIPTVPILAYDVLLRDLLEQEGQPTIKDLSNGSSTLSPKHLREGIVIRPMNEIRDETLGGRLILKQRSPDYLAKTDN